jgi:hypothetical protein
MALPTSRKAWMPIGVRGRKTPWATLKEKYSRVPLPGGGAPSGSGNSVVIGRACVSQIRPSASTAISVSCGAP